MSAEKTGSSAAPAQGQMPSPQLIMETMNAHQRTAALKGAIELDLFTAIGEQGSAGATAAAVATRVGANEKGVRVLCDSLVVFGLLNKAGKGYSLTPDSAAFLDRRSPMCIASATLFLNSPSLTEYFRDMAACARKGGTILTAEGTVAPDNPIWVEFARAMAPLMTLPAELIAKHVGAGGAPKKVLDIAAGHGMFGITLAKHFPEAEIYALDSPGVLALASENARTAGVAARHHDLPGSAFDVDFGTGYDVVLLTNFLHHFDAPTCEGLLRKVHAALAPGGRAVTLEFVPNDDRVTPPMAASFALIMLATTAHGDAYTYVELERMAKNAGFARSEYHPLPPTPQSIVISHK